MVSFMDFKELVNKEIERQEQRIVKLQHEIETARTYLKAQRDMLKLLPADGTLGVPAEEDSTLRAGGDPAKVRDILKQAGTPLHVMELLNRLGKPQTREHRANLTGTLGAYVRKNRVFVKTAPNTFGLIGALSVTESDDVPDSFGTPEADRPKAAPPPKPAPANSNLDEDVPF